ncbi:hypothetical protein [Rhodobacter capsulatus]|uniref:hypothetical protein n=1 Tax=Rhodobacter capsulatus TaxID=1061 RepID=UPI004029F9D7
MNAIPAALHLQALLGQQCKPPEMERAAEAGTSRGSENLPKADFCELTRSHPTGLETSLEITIFPDTRASTARHETLSLRDLAQMVRMTRAKDKGNLPLWKLGTFGESRTIKGSVRFDANLLRVTGIEGDHDAGSMTAQEAASRLGAADIAALVHEPPSHRPEAPRWRVLCPLAEPVAREARADLVARLNGALGGILAPESFTPSQAFYFGAIEGLPERGGDAGGNCARRPRAAFPPDPGLARRAAP